MAERAMFKGVINLIIKQDDKVLLFFRNDGFFNYDGGWWVLPAGHIEQGETAMAAAIMCSCHQQSGQSHRIF